LSNEESKAPNQSRDADECLVPCPRSGHAMVYNEANHSLVIFGGRKSKNADGDMNDLWEFNIEESLWLRVKEGEKMKDPK